MSKVTLKVEIEEKDYKALIGQGVFNIWQGNTILSTIFNAIKTAKPIEECDDCVSRQEAIHCVTETELYNETFAEAKMRIAELKPVLPKREQGEWINVKDRLPENTQPVLMTIRRMSKLYNHEPFITVGYISWNQTTWWCAHDGDCVRNEIEVLAWMPLPEPYKESEVKE